jgi:hypothetical protein
MMAIKSKILLEDITLAWFSENCFVVATSHMICSVTLQPYECNR